MLWNHSFRHVTTRDSPIGFWALVNTLNRGMFVVHLTDPFIYLTRLIPRVFTPQVVDLCKRSPLSYAVHVGRCLNVLICGPGTGHILPSWTRCLLFIWIHFHIFAVGSVNGRDHCTRCAGISRIRQTLLDVCASFVTGHHAPIRPGYSIEKGSTELTVWRLTTHIWVVPHR